MGNICLSSKNRVPNFNMSIILILQELFIIQRMEKCNKAELLFYYLGSARPGTNEERPSLIARILQTPIKFLPTETAQFSKRKALNRNIIPS